MIRLLLEKRTIAIVAGAAIVLYIIGWAIAGAFVHCTPTTTSGNVTCSAPTAPSVISGIFFFFAWIATVLCWAMALVKTYRVRQWVWLVLCFILPPFTPLLYGIFGRETPVNNRPTYVEGTPPTPVHP